MPEILWEKSFTTFNNKTGTDKMSMLTTRVIRKMGYLNDSRGIAERFISQSASWNEHLRNTREFVIQVLEGREINNLVVLGSGWLVDLPLEQVSLLAGNIYLYDIVHPAQVLHKIRKYKNIKAVAADITGGSVMTAYEAVRKYRKKGIKSDVATICKPGFQPDVDTDYMISLNVLSQLGALINEYLARHMIYDEDELVQLNQLIQNEHIQLLRKVPSCLISDYEEVVTDLNTGRKNLRKLIHSDIPGARKAVKWDWHFDMTGDYYPGKQVVLKVMALEMTNRQGVTDIRQYP